MGSPNSVQQESTTKVLFLLTLFSWLAAAWFGWMVEPFVGTIAYDLGTGNPLRWAYFVPFSSALAFTFAVCFYWSMYLIFGAYRPLSLILPIIVTIVGSVLVFIAAFGGFHDPVTLSRFISTDFAMQNFIPRVVGVFPIQPLLFFLCSSLIGTTIAFGITPRAIYGNKEERELGYIDRVIRKSLAFVFGAFVGAIALIITVLSITNGGTDLISAVTAWEQLGIFSWGVFLLGAIIALVAFFYTRICSSLFAKIIPGIVVVAVGLMWAAWFGFGLEVIPGIGDFKLFPFAIGFLFWISFLDLLLTFVGVRMFFSRSEAKKLEALERNRGINWIGAAVSFLLVASVASMVPFYYSIGIWASTGSSKLASVVTMLRNKNGMKHYLVEKQGVEVPADRAVPLIHLKDSNDYVAGVENCILANNIALLRNEPEQFDQHVKAIKEAAEEAKLPLRFHYTSIGPNGKDYLDFAYIPNTPPALDPNDLGEGELVQMLEDRKKNLANRNGWKKSQQFLPRAFVLENAILKPGMEVALGACEIEYYNCKFEEGFDFEKYLKNRQQFSIKIWDNCEMSEKQWDTIRSVGPQDTMMVRRCGEQKKMAAAGAEFIAKYLPRVKMSYREARPSDPIPVYKFAHDKQKWTQSNLLPAVEMAPKADQPPVSFSVFAIETNEKQELVGFNIDLLQGMEQAFDTVKLEQIVWLVAAQEIPEEEGHRKVENPSYDWFLKVLNEGKLDSLQHLVIRETRNDDDTKEFWQIVNTAVTKNKQLRAVELAGSVTNEFLKEAANSHVETLVVGRLDDVKLSLTALKQWTGLKTLVIKDAHGFIPGTRAPRKRGRGGMSAVGPERPRYKQKQAESFANIFLSGEEPFKVALTTFRRPHWDRNGMAVYQAKAKLLWCTVNKEQKEEKDKAEKTGDTNSDDTKTDDKKEKSSEEVKKETKKEDK